MIKLFHHCSCYYTHNVYIKSINKHFTYINRDQFFHDYDKVLNALDYSITDKESLIEEVGAEISRRKLLHEKTLARQKLIDENYIRSDISIYILEDHFLHPSFIKLVDASKCLNYEETLQLIDKISLEKKIYGFPVFKPDFCRKFLEELYNFEMSNLPKERPNTMNNYGILIDDLGFHDNFSMPLRLKYLDPLVKVLFPEWRGQGLDSHKIFTVGYTFGKDTELGYHFDNSEVTLNVCLGKQFEGGELYFGDMKTIPISESTCISVPHKVGYGILHRGQQYHGALPITSGERHNLICWMRSSSIRNSLCPMCNLKPSLVQSEGYADGFTKPQEMMLCDLV